VADHLGHRSVRLVQVVVGEVPGNARKPLHPGNLFDACLHPTPLVPLWHAVEDLLGFGGSLDLEAVERLLLLGTTLAGCRRGDRGFVDLLETGALANGASLRFLDPGRTPAPPANPGRRAVVAAHDGLCSDGLDTHRAGGMLGHDLGDGEIDDRGADNGVPAFHRIAADGGAGY